MASKNERPRGVASTGGQGQGTALNSTSHYKPVCPKNQELSNLVDLAAVEMDAALERLRYHEAMASQAARKYFEVRANLTRYQQMLGGK